MIDAGQEKRDKIFLESMAFEYNIRPQEGQELSEIITPDFIDGTHTVIEAFSIHASANSLRLDSKSGEASILPVLAFGDQEQRQEVTAFVYGTVAYRHMPQNKWSIDFKRGVDASIQRHIREKKKIDQRAIFNAAQNWALKHPVLNSLGLRKPLRRLAELIS